MLKGIGMSDFVRPSFSKKKSQVGGCVLYKALHGCNDFKEPITYKRGKLILSVFVFNLSKSVANTSVASILLIQWH